MNEEIAGGLKNAIERGYSIDSAVKSLVNAGYNPEEVNAAVASLSRSGVASIISPQKAEPKMLSPDEIGRMIETTKAGKSKGAGFFAIILILILLLLIASSIILLLFFPDIIRGLF